MLKISSCWKGIFMKNSSSSFKIRVRSILEECKHFLLYLSICRFPVLNCTITLHNHIGFVLTYMKLYTKWWHTVIKLCCILWDCLDLKFWCLNVPITDKFKCPVPYGFRTQEGHCVQQWKFGIKFWFDLVQCHTDAEMFWIDCQLFWMYWKGVVMSL